MQPLCRLIVLFSATAASMAPAAESSNLLSLAQRELASRDQAGREQWLRAALVARLDAANRALLKPTELAAARAKDEGLLRRAAAEDPASADGLKELLVTVDEREKMAVERLARTYRMQVYDVFRANRDEFDRRQGAWNEVEAAWQASGSRAEDQQRLIQWLASGVAAVQSGAAMPAVPRFGETLAVPAPRVEPRPPVAKAKPPVPTTPPKVAEPPRVSATVGKPVVPRPAPLTAKPPAKSPTPVRVLKPIEPAPTVAPEAPTPAPPKTPAVEPKPAKQPAPSSILKQGPSVPSPARVLKPSEPSSPSSVPMTVPPAPAEPTPSRPAAPATVPRQAAQSPTPTPGNEAVESPPPKAPAVEPKATRQPAPSSILKQGTAPATAAPVVEPAEPFRQPGLPKAETQPQRPAEPRPAVETPTPPAIPRRTVEPRTRSKGVEAPLPTPAAEPARDAKPAETPAPASVLKRNTAGPAVAPSRPESATPKAAPPDVPPRARIARRPPTDSPLAAPLTQPAAPRQPSVPGSLPALPRTPEPSPSGGSHAQVNLEELAARVGGHNMALRALEETLHEEKTWTVEELSVLVDQLADLVTRRGDLKLFVDLVPAGDRARAGDLESTDTAVGTLAIRVLETKARIAGPGFKGGSAERDAALSLLAELSRRLKALGGQPLGQ
jgi:GAF domain-containing protein